MIDFTRIRYLTSKDFVRLLSGADPTESEALRDYAQATAQAHFGKGIYVRGLIEISNVCKNNCYYCGLRRDNATLGRYRLTSEEILSSCRVGYEMGFRTFVLQGGEDAYWRGARLEDLVREIRTTYPDAALTLSLGEMERDEYQALFDAGANRYLLRHETHNFAHYARLHPREMSGAHRLMCLAHLREIGYQAGTGIMVGPPAQTLQHLAEDLAYIRDFRPHMVGIGPFLTHHDTPFRDEKNGDLMLTLRFVALTRLLCPEANIPATTAVATLHPRGRLMAIQHGANVVMPNLSPPSSRRLYSLYDHKAHLGAEAAEGLRLLEEELRTIDYHIDFGRGDFRSSRRTV